MTVPSPIPHTPDLARRFSVASRLAPLLVGVALACALAISPAARAASAPTSAEGSATNPRPHQPMHMIDEYVIGGEGGWGELEFDPASKRLFLARARSIQVVDTVARKVIKEIPCAEGLHSLALAPDLRRGYVASTSDSSVLVFDLDSLRAVQTLKLVPATVGLLVYDPGTARVFVLDPAGTVTAIDAKTGAVVGTHDLAAQPQAAIADGAGALFVALPAQDAVAVLDARTLLERARWPLDSGARPMALAYDAVNHRLFAAGSGLLLSILETDRGHAVMRVPVGGGVQRLVFDPGKHLLVSLGNGGVSSTLWQQSADQYSMVATIGTSSGARTMTMDAERHVAYLVAGDNAPPLRSAKGAPRPDPALAAAHTTVYVLAP